MKTFVIDKEALKKAWGADGQYWFSLDDYKIVEDIDFLELSVSDGMDKDDILKLEEFVPYLNIKRSELAKAYVDTIDNPKVKSKFENLDEDETVEYFWKYFHVYPELFQGLEQFENDFIICKLKKWCEKHAVNYTVE